MKKAIIFTMEYPPYFWGGAGVMAKELAIALSNNGIRTIVYVFSKIRKKEIINDNLRINWIKIKTIKGLNAISAIWEARRILRDNVNSETIIFNITTILAYAFKKNSTNCFTLIHHTPRDSVREFGYSLKEISGDLSILPVGNYIFKKAVSKSTNLIFVSEVTKKHFEYNYPEFEILLKKSLVIYNGAPKMNAQMNELKKAEENLNKIISKPDNCKIYTYIGSKDRRKGTDVLLNAFKHHMSNNGENQDTIILIFAGDKNINVSFDNYKINENENSSDLKILNFGRISEAEKINLLKISNFIVLGSYSEGLPTIILEGLSYSKPFIATKTAGAMNIFNLTKAGLLSEIGDYKKFAQNIKYSLKKETHEKLKLKANESKDYFSWNNSVKKYIELIENFK